MSETSDIQAHMEIVGACGHHVGTVDHLDGDAIKLTRNSSPQGRHTWLPLDAVAGVADGKVMTRMDHAEAIALLSETPPAG